MSDVGRQEALRILDANANRAAEGLRTIEDVARLVREDPLAAEWMKTLRHQLSEACQQFSRSERLAARSAETDAGTALSVGSETSRGDVNAIVTAAAERITQSLRCLEEFSKILGEHTSEPFKQLRYAAYDVLAKTELRLAEHRMKFGERLILLIDCSLDLDEFVPHLRSLCDAGVDCFQIRDKQADGAVLVQYAKAAVQGLQGMAAKVFVNDRVDIALASGAAGVHLGQEDLSLAEAQNISNGKLLIGISTHDIEQAVTAEMDGADYIGCGPTFRSQTKTFSEFPGLEFLEQVANRVRIPFVSIGGIDLSNVGEVVAAGCSRIAVSNAIHSAAVPTLAASSLRKLLG